MALKQIGDETITISSTAIGFTSTEIPGEKPNVCIAKVYVESGGPIRWNMSADPTGGGSEGSPLAFPEAVLSVSGELQDFQMIVNTGWPDATVRVAYFGNGGN